MENKTISKILGFFGWFFLMGGILGTIGLLIISALWIGTSFAGYFLLASIAVLLTSITSSCCLLALSRILAILDNPHCMQSESVWIQDTHLIDSQPETSVHQTSESSTVPADIESKTDNKSLLKVAGIFIITLVFIFLVASQIKMPTNAGSPPSTHFEGPKVSPSTESMTYEGEINQKYKNEALEELIAWTLKNASKYGHPSVGTNDSFLIDDKTYAVIYNFKAPNAFGTKVKYKLSGVYDLSNDTCKLVMLKLDDENIFYDEEYFSNNESTPSV